jgi:hypothetical protein
MSVLLHCPTGEMVADYFTKPLQGAIFLKFRNMIMNVDKVDPLTDSHKDQRSVLGSEDKSNHESNDQTAGLEDGEIYEPGGLPTFVRADNNEVSEVSDTQKRNALTRVLR